VFGKILAVRVFLRFIAVFLFSLLSVAAQANEAKFAWSPNTETNLAGYKIHYGTGSRNYTSSVDVGKPPTINGSVNATLTGFVPGTTYYFAATAYDTNGFESDYSNEVVWTVPVVVVAPPTASDTALTIAEDTAGGGRLAGVSADGSPLTYQLVTSGSLGSAAIVDAATGAFTYTPAANVSGVDSFTYKVSDVHGVSNVATVTVTIAPVNDAPAAQPGQVATDEDMPVSGTLAGSDLEGNTLTYAIVSQGILGRVVLTNAATGAFSYTPAAQMSGADSFTFKVNDGAADSNIATVAVTVRAVNDAPLAQDGVLSVTENGTSTGTLAGSDPEGGALIYSIINAPALGTVTSLNPATGAYRYTPLAGVFGEDAFLFAVTDDKGAMSNAATVTVSIAEVPDGFALETGALTVNSTWQAVTFAEPFVDPVVVAKPVGNNDVNPCVVRIRNLTSTGFEIRLQNWNYLPDTHAAEQVTFIALERGRHTLEDGTMIEAGLFSTNKVGTFVPVKWSQTFNVVPVVAASIVSANDADAVDGRMRKISTAGFEYTMQEQELNSKTHGLESIAYIAWEPSAGQAGDLTYEVGVTADAVTDAWHVLSFSEPFPVAPGLIADMQTTGGIDPANLRYMKLTAGEVQIKIAEERSKDKETSHTTEVVGFMAFAQTGLVTDADGDGLSSRDELEIYGTNPAEADTDNDGMADGEELYFWQNDWNADADQDGLINLLDPDADNDGYTDGIEFLNLTDPAYPGAYPG
jgi:hypothetical protein